MIVEDKVQSFPVIAVLYSIHGPSTLLRTEVINDSRSLDRIFLRACYDRAINNSRVEVEQPGRKFLVTHLSLDRTRPGYTREFMRFLRVSSRWRIEKMIVDDQGKALTSRFQRKKSEIQIATVNQVKEEEISSKSVKSFILFLKLFNSTVIRS